MQSKNLRIATLCLVAALAAAAGAHWLYASAPTADLTCTRINSATLSCTGTASPSGNYRGFYRYNTPSWGTLSPDGAGPWTFYVTCKEGAAYPTFTIYFRACVLPGLTPEAIDTWVCNPQL